MRHKTIASKQLQQQMVESLLFLNIIFLVCPIWLPVFSFFQLLNEPGLGAGINPGMALTPLPSSIGWD
jgi:hypothetical protein